LTKYQQSGGRIRVSIAALLLAFFPIALHAGMTVTGANIIDRTTVAPGTVFVLRVTVGGDTSAINNRTWRSAQVLADATPLQCVNIGDALTGGIVGLVPLRLFNVAAPAAPGSYTISVVANNNDSCTGAVSSAPFAAPQTLTVSADPATPIAFVGATTAVKAADATNPQEIDVTVPAGSTGDVLVAIVTTDGPTDVAPVDTAEWTLISSGTMGGLGGDLTDSTAGMWYHIATGSEPASYKFAWTVDSNPPPEQQATAAILRYSGVDTNGPVNASAFSNGFDQHPLAPDVTTTVPGAVVVRTFGLDGVASPLYFPAGTRDAIASSPIGTDPAPHGRFWTVSNSSAPLNAVSTAGADAVQLGGAGPTGTAEWGLNIITDKLWRAFTVALAPAVDLSLAKTESIDPVVAGSGPDNLVYTITLTNTGVTPATNITVDETPNVLPGGVTVSSVVPATGSFTSPVWTVPSLAAGASTTLTVNLTVDATASPGTDVISNTATITGSTEGRINTGDESATVATSIAASADISTTKTDSPDPANAGASLTYTITIGNAGPSAAANTAWSDTLPAGTTFVSLTSPGGWSCTTPAVGAGGTVNCSIATLAPGNAVFTLVVAIDPGIAAGTIIANTATASTTTSDPASGNDSATSTTTVNTSADLAITKSDAPDPVIAGTNIAYNIDVTNNGTSVANTVSWSDTLPASTTFVSLSAAAGWSCTTPAVGAAGTITCSIASLPVRTDNFTLTIATSASLTDGSIITNTATVTAATTDPTPGNNTATATTAVGSGSADLSISKTGPSTVSPGQTFSYTITASNAGPSAATTASWTDTLPPNTTFASLSAAAGWSCTTPAVGAAGTVTCSNASFAPGSAMFTLDVTLANSVSAGTTISNTATIASSTGDPNGGNGSSTAGATVSSPATLSATKSVTGSFTPLGAITYTIVLPNTGASAQGDNPGDEFTDVLPAMLHLVSASATSGTAVATIATNTVTWNGAIASGDSVTITVQATIDGAAPNGSTISNQGSYSFDADGNGTNESTGLTDDPSIGGASDPTSFAVAIVPPVPALDPASLALLVLLLAVTASLVLRKL
jgi:uncharacterized repeat protein (TIGR01451 family)